MLLDLNTQYHLTKDSKFEPVKHVCSLTRKQFHSISVSLILVAKEILPLMIGCFIYILSCISRTLSSPCHFADTVVYEKLCTELTKAPLVKGIKKASPLAQTSCLEGFHSVVNQYAPKTAAYSYQGMYCRYL